MLRRCGPPVGLYVVICAFVIWHVRQLESPAIPDLWPWAVLALAPALAAVLVGGEHRAARLYGLFAVPTLVAAIGFATGHWPFRPHLRGDDGYFRLVGGELRDGLDRWVRTILPFDPDRYSALHTVVLLAIFICLAALAAALVVFRAPYPAMIAAFVPFLVVSTVYILDHVAFRAAVFLALALAILAVLQPRRRPGLQLAAGAAVILVAVAAAAVPGVAKSALLDWKQWGKADRPGESVAFIWDHSYGGLSRPDKPVRLLRVYAKEPAYWRAVVLGRFNGIAWVEETRVVQSAAPPALTVPPDQLAVAPEGATETRQQVRVKNVNLATTHVVGPSEIVAIAGIDRDAARIDRTDEGVFRTAQPIPVDSEFTVDTVQVKPDLKVLKESQPNYPEEILRQGLPLLPDGTMFPVYGAPGREQVAADIFSQSFWDPAVIRWKDAYAQSRTVTRDAESAFEVVAALEADFQENFTYDETADYADAPDGPLPAFYLDGKTGYCQMFAGTMTVLLRMYGIPARVGEGFVEGQQDEDGRYFDVTDRDAHAWVEVWFPEYGWLAFEPTPTRTLPNDYSTTSPDFSKAATAAFGGPTAGRVFNTARLDDLARALGSPGGLLGPTGRGGRAEREAGDGTGAGGSGAAWRPGFVSFIALLAFALVALLVLVKRLRGVLPYVRREPHRIAGAVRRDLEAFVRDQGVPAAVTTLTPREFATMLYREFGVDAQAWAAEQARARYGPRGRRSDDAAHNARRESRLVKRRLRRALSVSERTRGAVRVRSLLP